MSAAATNEEDQDDRYEGPGRIRPPAKSETKIRVQPSSTRALTSATAATNNMIEVIGDMTVALPQISPDSCGTSMR